MKQLEKGDRVRFRGESTDLLTNGVKYKVLLDIVECLKRTGLTGIAIKDDEGELHYITEDFFRDNFNV